MRPGGRMFLARTGWGGRAVMLRNGWHWLFGNVFSVGFKVVLWLAFSFSPFPWDIGLDVALIVTVVYGLAFMVAFQLATNGGAPSRVIMRFRVARAVFGWRLAWRFRARWPMEWAIPANKTKAVQAEVGSTSEATVTIRPVFDAPKLSWWPRLEWPMISWWVSPPPGRTFEQFEELLDVLASNIANVVSINLDYERSSSSIGRLSVLFDDPLAEPVLPEFHVSDVGGSHADVDLDLADVVDLRPLRLVEDLESEVG
ncbi:MAG: hypothetical protein ACRBK7_02190 [Acidimicrobiales bacterium]